MGIELRANSFIVALELDLNLNAQANTSGLSMVHSCPGWDTEPRGQKAYPRRKAESFDATARYPEMPGATEITKDGLATR